MKKFIILSILAVFLPVTMMAQDDVYFTPKKVEKKAVKAAQTKSEVQPAVVTHSGSSRDVDEYNRRGLQSYYQKIGTDSLGNDIIEFHVGEGYPSTNDTIYAGPVQYDFDDADSDYEYTRRMSRWDGFYDPWFYGYGWGYPYYWNGWAHSYIGVGRNYASTHIGMGTIRNDGATHRAYYKDGRWSVENNSSRMNSIRQRADRQSGGRNYSSGNNKRSRSGNFSGYRGNSNNNNSSSRSSNSSFSGTRSSSSSSGSFSGGGGGSSRSSGGGGGRSGGRR